MHCNRAAFVVLLALVGLVSNAEAASLGATCKMDDAISAGDKVVAQDTARSFVETAIQGDIRTAYSLLSSTAREGVSYEDFEGLLTVTKLMGPFEGLHPIHVYRVDLDQGPTAQHVICGTRTSNSEWADVAVAPVSVQFHITLSARTINNDWAFNVWLTPAAKGWAIQDFNVGPRTSGRRSASEILAQARQQRREAHYFNAALLYRTGLSLSIPGLSLRRNSPAIVLGIDEYLRSDLSTLHAPAEAVSDSPSVVAWGGSQFHIGSISTTGIGSDLNLVISFTDSRWDGNDNAAAEKMGHLLIDAFRAAYPEYQEAFPGVIARLLKADGSGGYSTVFDNKTGYVK